MDKTLLRPSSPPPPPEVPGSPESSLWLTQIQCPHIASQLVLLKHKVLTLQPFSKIPTTICINLQVQGQGPKLGTDVTPICGPTVAHMPTFNPATLQHAPFSPSRSPSPFGRLPSSTNTRLMVGKGKTRGGTQHPKNLSTLSMRLLRTLHLPDQAAQ